MIEFDKLLAGDVTQFEALLLATCAPGEATEDLTTGAQSEVLSSAAMRVLISKAPRKLVDRKFDYQLFPGLIEYLHQQHDATQLIDEYHLCLAFFIDKVFVHYFESADIDLVLQRQLSQLKTIFYLTSLDNHQACFLSNKGDEDNDATSLLDELIFFGAGWYSNLEKLGKRFYEKVETGLGELVDNFSRDAVAYQKAQKALLKFIKHETHHSQLLTERYCAAESGVLHLHNAQKVVIELLNKKMLGNKLPKAVIEFLHGDWKDSLQLILINDGVGSNEWKRSLRLTDTLIWSVQVTDKAEDLQKIYNIIPRIGIELEKSLVSLKYDEVKSGAVLEEIQSVYMSVLKKEDLAYEQVFPLSIPGGAGTAVTSVSQELMQEVEDLEVGQWFMYRNEDDELIRCRLALKLSETNQLIFVDMGGLSSIQKTFDEFAYCLASNIARKILQVRPVDECNERLLKKFYQHYLIKQKQQSFVSAKEEALARLSGEEESEREDLPLLDVAEVSMSDVEEEAEAEADEEEAEADEEEAEADIGELDFDFELDNIDIALNGGKDKSLAEEEKNVEIDERVEEEIELSKQKAKLEAAEISRRRVDDELRKKQQMLDIQKQQQMMTMEREAVAKYESQNEVQHRVDELDLGAWISFKVDGEEKVGKLAAKMRSTGRLIFVDRLGIKVLELKMPELTQLIIDGDAKILEEGNVFETTLAQVVGSLRKDV